MFGIILLIQSFLVTESLAIFGVYIPEEEHIPQTCKLSFVNLRELRVPLKLEVVEEEIVDKRTGKKRKVQKKVLVEDKEKEAVETVEADAFYCSSTLIASDAVATSAHCTQKIIQRKPMIEAVPVVKQTCDENGQNCLPIPGCNRPDWSYIKSCIEKVERFGVLTSIDKVKVSCPATDGMEERFVEWNNAWPHPDYQSDKHNSYTAFDVAVFRVDEAFEKVKPIKFADDLFYLYYLLENPELMKTCRILGYGRDNDNQSGILHGIYLNRIAIERHMLGFENSYSNAAPGDSGGTLVCKNAKGEDVLIGITSLANRFDPYELSFEPRTNVFVNTTFPIVNRYMHYVVNLPKKARHNNTIVDKYVSEYLLNYELPGVRNELQACIDMHSPYYNREKRKNYFRGYKELLKQVDIVYADIKSEYDQWSAGNKIIHSHVSIKPSSKAGAYLDKDVIYSVSLGEPMSFERNNYGLDILRTRMGFIFPLLRAESHGCHARSLGNDGKGHFIMDNTHDIFKKVKAKKIQEYKDAENEVLKKSSR
ncbi:MAG: trypsin-like serine protease [Bacteriovoracaceae bacterium]|nr:trypsin-like serine protease [Bacteriovoracaceae bacterium]